MPLQSLTWGTSFSEDLLQESSVGFLLEITHVVTSITQHPSK
ncbi:MAG TPA: hypothetical protein PKV58_00745 [Kaistella sp.]|nr:hypothetical protein [Kaistella sp.]HPZ24445.1 hypothetical protein [Kaistella sp.]HQD45124.1 hypothetical protein [Kaistella sp.]